MKEGVREREGEPTHRAQLSSVALLAQHGAVVLHAGAVVARHRAVLRAGQRRHARPTPRARGRARDRLIQAGYTQHDHDTRERSKQGTGSGVVERRGESRGNIRMQSIQAVARIAVP